MALVNEELATAFENVATDLRSEADSDRAEQMAAYLKGQFECLGVPSPTRKSLQRPLLAAAKTATAEDVIALADRCWRCDEREFRYVATDLLRARAKALAPTDLAHLRRFITSDSWWDTVDALAVHPVGTLVSRFPELKTTMDEWIDDPDIWVARTAILHQMRYKTDLDEQRLFDYALRRAHDTEFFIRKALGWALRNHARVAPDRVRSFVKEHEDALSGLTKREALKHLN